MTSDDKPKKIRRIAAKAPLDAVQARETILQALEKAGTKGSPSLGAKATVTANGAAFDEAWAALQTEGVAVMDRTANTPRYYLKQFAPSQRKLILGRLRKAGIRGVTALFTAKASASLRAVIEEEAAALEREGEIVVNRSGKAPKYFLEEFAPKLPSLENACASVENYAAQHFPELLNQSQLKKGVHKEEAALFDKALYWLENQREIVRLHCGKAVVFLSVRALRAAIGEEERPHEQNLSFPPAPSAEPKPELNANEERHIRNAYNTLVQNSGFSSVKIGSLQRESGVALGALHEWLRAEYRQGRAVLSFGDWSLSDEPTRAAALELRGERYLLVKLPQ